MIRDVPQDREALTMERRELLGVVAALALPGIIAAPAAAMTRPDDFGFETGCWRVGHRRLRHWLVGSTDWIAFDGTCIARPLLGGAGNVDDHLLMAPTGAYRAASLRRRDPENGAWSIWWWDSRLPDIDPPVVGGFADGVATFHGESDFNGRTIQVRTRYFDIRRDSARWEQAFSADNGANWETNWTMAFERAE